MLSYLHLPIKFILIVVLNSLVSLSLFANSPVQDGIANATNLKANNAYAFDRCRALQAKPFDKNSKKKKVIIIGDSQGCDFLNSALENGHFKNYQIQFRFIPYPCQTVPGEYISKYIVPRHRRFCTAKGRTDNLELAKEQVQDADLLIFASLWKPEVAKKLPKIIHYLSGKKPQKLIVIGNKFFGNMKMSEYFHMTNRELRSITNDVGTESMEVNSILKQKTQGKISFIDPHKLICGNSTRCPIFTNNLRPISYDGRHLTKAGARYVGKIMFQNSVLRGIDRFGLR